MEQKARVSSIIALKQIVETTSAYTGRAFFRALVKHLGEILDVHGVWVTELWRKEHKFNALAFWLDGDYVEQYEYLITDTPCEPVLESHSICHIPKNVVELYPKDPDLAPLGAVSYMGISLRNENDEVIGHLALLDNKPMPEIPEAFAIFRIFAARAAAELRRELAQQKLMESESKLSRLVNGTSDAIVEFDASLLVTQVNDAARKLFDLPFGQLPPLELKELFDAKSYYQIKSILPQHSSLSNKNRSLHLNEALTCVTANKDSFPAETNLSCYEEEGAEFYVLYLRNIKSHLSDQQTIKVLHLETAVLKEKVAAEQFDYIIGNSEGMRASLDLVQQVGPTDANVLITGETGTGKELFAKAVHDSSTRAGLPMITLNCAALPSELIESELFGHVKGAFTGALSAREGRFALAHKSTLFLDEIAELPLQLQAKLLRVIQEGSFEPVGSSETKYVDVRIIAATHRDLQEQVQAGHFREDLFYRLNVFPIQIPPLRERGSDVALLANAFFNKVVKREGLNLLPFTQDDLAQLGNYHWPGNVRELQNIVERSIIISRGEKPELESIVPSGLAAAGKEIEDQRILSFDELQQLERQNIIKALNRTNWRISGEDGAAALLNLPRTTLASKIKKFSIKRRAE